jgi:6-phosphogluconolactonase
MPNYVYVAAQDDDKISIFTMEDDSGKLSLQGEVAVSGGPSPLALSPDRSVLYVGQRNDVAISSYSIDPNSGGLTRNGSINPETAASFLATDRTGRHLLSSYYQSGHIAVHPLGADGSVGDGPTEWIATQVGAHAMQTDGSNRFAFVPHIARLNDNVMEPPKDAPGPNSIYQYKFDENTGRLSHNDPLELKMTSALGPRHLTFHPTLDVVYFSDEQGCSVTAYHLDGGTGTLSGFQTVSTLPEGVTVRNTCSQIQITPSGDFLYVPNRGHNSIAGFSVDSGGRLTPAGHASTEAVPSAFSLDPSGKFMYAAGSATGVLASYRVNSGTGELTPMDTYPVGSRPMSVMTATVGS